jgi:hypothetical protein
MHARQPGVVGFDEMYRLDTPPSAPEALPMPLFVSSDKEVRPRARTCFHVVPSVPHTCVRNPVLLLARVSASSLAATLCTPVCSNQLHNPAPH